MITTGPTSGAPGRSRRTVPVLTALVAVTALTGLAACGGGDEPDPAPTTTTVTPTSTPTTPGTSAPATATSSGPGADCGAIRSAQAELDAAYDSELERLDIGRGDPRAQTVFTIVTTTEGPEYYADVLDAAPPQAQDDAQVVLDYYTRLAERVGTLEAGTGSAEDLARAMDALDAARDPDPSAATEVVQAQERLQAEIERACAGTPADASPSEAPSQSPSGSPTTTG
ncbi:hypothetical protein AB2L27_11235 [Kineococcus sp. LSe6-4]|uniref:DUF305 domain-containing protein n=1 Tax=Kineococcus halophytocola TaxID=3234027 RepID=A0ABV4H183_9ACTN